MKKLITIIFIFLLVFDIIYGKEANYVKGVIVDKTKDSIEIKDLKSKKILKIKLEQEKEINLKKGEIVKIFFDKTGKIKNFKKCNLFKIRERIKRIREFRHGGGSGKGRRGHHGGWRR